MNVLFVYLFPSNLSSLVFNLSLFLLFFIYLAFFCL